MAEFAIGDQVAPKANSTKVGLVAAVFESGTSLQYEVFFNATETVTFPEAALLPFGETDQPAGPIEMLRRWELGSPEQFRSFLTLAKLSRPVADNLYSFLASRTELLPYQFKPVLKLIDSPYPRILIADEVGLGKTIEAGIILTELNARSSQGRVLIVCPSSLVGKWRVELRQRFDWDFTVHDGPSLRESLEEVATAGEYASFRGIASLQLFRRAENLELLDELKPRFDAVIVDEAHHMRNGYTMSNSLGSYLGTLTETMVFLTATPLNLGQRDFFELLSLLVPEEFNDFTIFQELLEPNEPIGDALRILRRKWPPDFGAARDALKRIESTSQAARFMRDARYRAAVQRLESAVDGRAGPDRRWGVETQRMVGDLNTLSHVFTRTKKREVSEHFPTRRAHKVEVQFTPEEARFYHAVTTWAKYLYRETQMPTGFVTITYQRQVASSIQAMGRKLEEELGAGRVSFVDEELLGDLDEEVDAAEDGAHERSINPLGATESSDVHELEAQLPEEVSESELMTEMTQAWRAVRDSAIDTKFDQLEIAMRQVFEENSNEKVLIFSFFIRTIDYLEERLGEMEVGGQRVGVRKMYGGMTSDERTQQINEFRTSTGPQILISSEVGAEGLDFQWCSTMVNYDLPWNPMRVEQRIGRLDRYGQQSEVIDIFNLVIGDTIEDRIFYRLYERVRIFEESIGDLEAILGDSLGDLRREILTKELTEEEQEFRTNQIADAIENLQKEHEEFDEKSKRFVGVDEVFTDRFNDIREGERYITPAEIKNFIEGFLARKFPRIKLRPSAHPGDLEGVFDLTGTDDKAFIAFLNDAHFKDPHKSKAHQGLITRLQLQDGCALTFDSRTAMLDRSLEFFSIHHPVVRAIVLQGRDDGQLLPPTGKFILAADDLGGNLAPGPRIYVLFEIAIRGLRSEIELATVVVTPDGVVEEGASSRLLAAVARARAVDDQQLDLQRWLTEEAIERCTSAAREWAGQRVEEIREERDTIVSASIDQQLESLRLSHERRLNRLRRQLAEMEQQDQVSMARMRRGEITNVEHRYEEKTRELEARRGVEVSHRVVGAGVVDVA